MLSAMRMWLDLKAVCIRVKQAGLDRVVAAIQSRVDQRVAIQNGYSTRVQSSALERRGFAAIATRLFCSVVAAERERLKKLAENTVLQFSLPEAGRRKTALSGSASQRRWAVLDLGTHDARHPEILGFGVYTLNPKP